MDHPIYVIISEYIEFVWINLGTFFPAIPGIPKKEIIISCFPENEKISRTPQNLAAA